MALDDEDALAWILNTTSSDARHGHERRCYNVFRLHPTTFMKLTDELMERDLIRDSRYVTATEKLDAIGAIDGTHIPAHILREKQARYRNRKGVISQNVMGVCCFDLVFQYVGVGFEGAAADMAVLRRAMDFNPLAIGFNGRTLSLHNDLVKLFSGWGS
ncbi:hypothetical protein Taro_026808, partial [Colocasia esculenta]|nr:hypothetical protein [Colocasia esculenta]